MTLCIIRLAISLWKLGNAQIQLPPGHIYAGDDDFDHVTDSQDCSGALSADLAALFVHVPPIV